MDGWITTQELAATLSQEGLNADPGEPSAYTKPGTHQVVIVDVEAIMQHVPSIRDGILRQAELDGWDASGLMAKLEQIAYPPE